MFRRLPKRRKDNKRAQLTALVKGSTNVPKGIKAMAYLAIQTMSLDEVEKTLEVAKDLEPMVESGNVEGVRMALADAGLEPELIEQAERLMLKGWHGRGDDA